MSRAHWCWRIVTFVVLSLWVPDKVQADEPTKKPEVVVSSAFWQIKADRFFEDIGVDVDKQNGSFVLSDIENFFLIQAGAAAWLEVEQGPTRIIR